MTTPIHLVTAYAVSFVINVFPAFMPATWTVLAFFYVHYKLPLLILTVGGAVFSTLGRLVLAEATRRWGRKMVPAKQAREIDALGTWLEDRPAWQIPLAVFVISFVLPSNTLFISAGLTAVSLRPVALGFLVNRVISYTFAAAATSKAASSLQALLGNYWNSPRGIVLQLASLAAIVVFAKIPWSKILHISLPTDSGKAQAEEKAPAEEKVQAEKTTTSG